MIYTVLCMFDGFSPKMLRCIYTYTLAANIITPIENMFYNYNDTD